MWLWHWQGRQPVLLKWKKPGWHSSHLGPYTPVLHTHIPELWDREEKKKINPTEHKTRWQRAFHVRWQILNVHLLFGMWFGWLMSRMSRWFHTCFPEGSPIHPSALWHSAPSMQAEEQSHWLTFRSSCQFVRLCFFHTMFCSAMSLTKKKICTPEWPIKREIKTESLLFTLSRHFLWHPVKPT